MALMLIEECPSGCPLTAIAFCTVAFMALLYDMNWLSSVIS